MCSQKSTEACADAAAGGWAAGCVPGLDPTGLPRPAVPEVLLLLPLAPPLAGPSDPTYPGDRRDPRALRLSARSRPAATGGMERQCQTGVSALQGRRPADPDQTAQAQGLCKGPFGSQAALSPERGLGHGFPLRPALRRSPVPDPDDRGCLLQ